MCFCKADILQILVRILDDRREFIRMDRRDFLDHISNLIGVCNNYFFCFLASEISKFFQHFLGGTQIQRCLFICIREAASCHDDPSVNFILRVHEMHVAGCHYRLLKLFTQLHDPAVHFS